MNERNHATALPVPAGAPKSGAALPTLRQLGARLGQLLLLPLVGALGYLVAAESFLLDTEPFGLALVGAMPGALAPAALLGCVAGASAIPEEMLLYAAVYLGIFLTRALVCILFYKDGFPPPRALFRETVGARAAVAAFGALALGTYRLVTGGYLYYDVFRMAFFAVAVAVFTTLLAGGGRANLRMVGVSTATVGAVVYLGVTLLAGWSVGGVEPAWILALGAVFYGARYLGGARSAALGALLALPLELAGGTAAVLLPAAALTAGAFFAVSPYLALGSAAVASLGVAVAWGGFSGLMDALPEVLSVAVLMYPLLKFDVLPKLSAVPAKGEAVAEKLEIKHTEERLTMLSRAFSTLSGLMAGAVGKNKPVGGAELCLAACEKQCEGCASHKTCWGENRRETEGAIRELAELVRRGGRPEEREVPRALMGRCSDLHRVLREVEAGCAAYALADRRWGIGREASFAVNYEAISRLFRQVLYEEKEAFLPDEALTARVRHGMRKANFPAGAVHVYGGRKKYLVVEDVEVAGLELGCDDVRRLFENLSGLHLTSPEFSIDGRQVTMLLRTARRFRVESSYHTSMISGESANGDVVNTFQSGDDRFYALISDGMGSGEDAAVTSGLCSVFLERLLTGGAGREVSLGLLNDFIRSRGVECSATVDLAEIDLLTGDACFSKSGAAPTFVKRGTDIFKLQAKTIPVGIAREADVENVAFRLKRGDTVVMISDGGAAGFEESGWLLRMMDEDWLDDPDEMGRRILDGAKENNLRTDDMTVCLLRVS